MGFKTDSSFLQFLTMGALGTKQVMRELAVLGFQPIELERYSTSNKLWATKIKRLRLADLICVRTGLRAEVRAKSSLEIRMSHAPNNPDRYWDAGLRDEDVVALVRCSSSEGDSGELDVCAANYFTVGDLRQAADPKQLSALKAASEGSEQHLTWPSIVSSRPGIVVEIQDDRLIVEWRDDGRQTRRYTYVLRGKNAYVKRGDRFSAESSFLAGSPAKLIDFSTYLTKSYDPVVGLREGNVGDRYAATKTIPHRPDVHQTARPIIEELVRGESDARVRLEAARAASALGMSAGDEHIGETIWDGHDAAMRMEATFILTELGKLDKYAYAVRELTRIATNRDRFAGDEIRQAAVWGLGRAGLGAYHVLAQFLSDVDDNVVLHAIGAYGSDAPTEVIASLVNLLRNGNEREAAASSEALRIIDSEVAIRELAGALGPHARRAWVLATLGRMSARKIGAILAGSPVLNELEPLLLTGQTGIWTTRPDVLDSIRFLQRQS